MSGFLKDKFIRIRCRKAYHGAHNHVLIGRVVEETASYLAVYGKTFHFSRLFDGLKNQVLTGAVTTRIVPWSNIEIAHLQSGSVDFEADFGFDEQGNLVLHDAANTVIAERRDNLE